MRSLFPYKWYTSFWFSWLVLSIVYFFIVLALNGETSLVYIIGLFVPIGPFSAFFAPDGILLLILFIFLTDALSWSFGIKNVFSKIFFNVYILLFVTWAIESWFLGGWPSLVAFEWDNNVSSHPYLIAERLILFSFLLLIAIGIIRKIISRSRANHFHESGHNYESSGSNLKMEYSHHSSFVPISISAIMLLIGGGLYLFWMNIDRSTEPAMDEIASEKPAPTQSNATLASYKTYSDSEWDFDFTYPSAYALSLKYFGNGSIDNVILGSNDVIIRRTMSEGIDSNGKFGTVKILWNGVDWIRKESGEKDGAPVTSFAVPEFNTDSGLPVFAGATKGHEWGRYAYIVALSRIRFLIIEGIDGEPLIKLVKSIQMKGAKLLTYDDVNFLNFKYPEDFKIFKGTDPSVMQVFIYPQPQPIEFGPFMSFTVHNSSGLGLINDIKNRYKDSFISSEFISISGREWIRAVIRDNYFENVVYEYYYAPYKSGTYIEVIYSKGPYATEFFKILSSVNGPQ